MWIAKYLNIDKSGLNPEVKVFVEFSNDSNEIKYERSYEILSSELNTSFPKLIQNQIDILDAKDGIEKTDLDVLIGTEISVQSIDL